MRIIAHLDMDAFFASIEEADSSIFKGKPIAVGSDPLNGNGRGVVSTANYKAREYGIHSALPISQAWQLSQKAKKEGKDEVVFLPVNMERYQEVSCGIYDIIRNTLDSRFSAQGGPASGWRGNDSDKALIEPASIDEFYFDMTPSGVIPGLTRNPESVNEQQEEQDTLDSRFSAQGGPASGWRGNDTTTRLPRSPVGSLAMTNGDDEWDQAEKICQKIKDEIKQKYKITCSVGLAPNKLIAKIAAGQKKPDGFVVVRQGEEEGFLELLSIRELPGIGPKTEQILNEKGIKIIKDLKNFSYGDLYDMLGKYGLDLYYKAKGIDDSELVENREAKSIGEQTTFEKDTLDAVYIGEVFAKLCDDVFLRFKDSEFKSFKTIAITVRFKGFETKTTAKTLRLAIARSGQAKKEFKIEALKLLLPYLDNRKNPGNKLIRLIGVSIKNFL